MFDNKLKIVTITAIVVAFGIPALAMMPAERSAGSANLSLSLDGIAAGFLKSVAGGEISAEVINEPSGQKYFAKKHIGKPKYGNLEVELGFGNTKALYDWISASWKMSDQRKNLTVTTYDAQFQAKTAKDFYQSLITETTIPAMDSGSKEPSYITLKITPETIRDKEVSGGRFSGDLGKNEQKVLLPSNFRLEIAGLDCNRVNRIESFTVKQSTVTDDIGDARDMLKKPGKLEFPNLKITLAETSAESWKQWHKSFVIDGNNDESREKSGTLTLLSPSRETELARIKFINMGIFKIGPTKTEANTDQIKRVTAELYVERMEFESLNN